MPSVCFYSFAPHHQRSVTGLVRKSYSKIDSLFWMIVNAFGISITTFVGQNYGAGKMDRVHKGVRTCMGITAGATVLLSVILYNYASICYQLFTTDAQVVVIGEQILHFLVPTYFTYIAIEILSGTLRGIGDSWLPMIICCLGICALRVQDRQIRLSS